MPEDVAKNTKQTCKILSKCCAGKSYQAALSSLAENFINNPYDAARTTCLQSIDSDESNEICSEAVESDETLFEQTKEEKEISELYLNVRKAHDKELQQSTVHLGNICNPKEVHAYLCMLNNKHLKSCIRKLIEKQLELKGVEGAEQYVKQYKKTMGNINQKVQQLKDISA